MEGNTIHTLDIQKLFHNNFQPSQTCKKEINLYPEFYQELISLWEKVCIKEPVDIAEILSQPIWNNHFLQKQDSTLFYSELYRRGVLSIRDIVDKQGKFLTWRLAKEIKAVTSCSTHKIDQQETDGKNSKIRQSRS